jgi:hypothetical protein
MTNAFQILTIYDHLYILLNVAASIAASLSTNSGLSLAQDANCPEVSDVFVSPSRQCQIRTQSYAIYIFFSYFNFINHIILAFDIT